MSDIAAAFARSVEPALAQAEMIARDLASVIADESIPPARRIELAEEALAELFDAVSAFAERAEILKSACHTLIARIREGEN